MRGPTINRKRMWCAFVMEFMTESLCEVQYIRYTHSLVQTVAKYANRVYADNLHYIFDRRKK